MCGSCRVSDDIIFRQCYQNRCENLAIADKFLFLSRSAICRAIYSLIRIALFWREWIPFWCSLDKSYPLEEKEKKTTKNKKKTKTKQSLKLKMLLLWVSLVLLKLLELSFRNYDSSNGTKYHISYRLKSSCIIKCNL